MFGIAQTSRHHLHQVPRGRGKDKKSAIERKRRVGRGDSKSDHLKVKLRRGNGHIRNGIIGGIARGLVPGQHDEEMIGKNTTHSDKKPLRHGKIEIDIDKIRYRLQRRHRGQGLCLRRAGQRPHSLRGVEVERM